MDPPPTADNLFGIKEQMELSNHGEASYSGIL